MKLNNSKKSNFKKWLSRAALPTLLFLGLQTNAQAQLEGGSVEKLLALIEDHTKKTLEIVNKLPGYLEDVTIMAKSWNETEDDKKIIPDNQAKFASLDEAYSENKGVDQGALTNTMALKYIRGGSRDTNNPTVPPGINLNQIVYSTLLGKPVNPDDKEYKGNEKAFFQAYLDNASLVNYPLPHPDVAWSKENPYKKQYDGYYKTLVAVQSFDDYTLSRLYLQKEIESISKELTDKASNADWFTQVSTEDLGLVLRHILMYVSQSYVQSNRMALVQQQQLTAQVMTNTLLIMLVQQSVGDDLIRSANKFK